jgi:hypothetical protein
MGTSLFFHAPAFMRVLGGQLASLWPLLISMALIDFGALGMFSHYGRNCATSITERHKSADHWQSYCGLGLLLRDDSHILGCIGIG